MRRCRHWAVRCLMVGSALLAWSQPNPDAPGRGVARISLIDGDVSVRRGDSEELVAAGVNAPLMVQDHLLTGPGSRAELQFDYSNMLRIGPNSDVQMAELDFERYMVQAARGVFTWRVLRDQHAWVEISTPVVSVRPVKTGSYRVNVMDDGSAEIAVRSGEAEIYTARGTERLRAGRTMLVRGSATEPEFRTQQLVDDDWDRWNEQRDRDLLRSESYQYVPRDIYGTEDLDTYGRWLNVGNYGWVWNPTVGANWAPYRDGRWTWVDYYGWTWVSNDPWGWAPFHYGRWSFEAPYGWLWHPGRIGTRNHWAPACVAFFGLGDGWGRVGWVPLAPFEPWRPWWGPGWSGGYRNNVNLTTLYRNTRVNGGYTVVDEATFRRGRVPAQLVRVSDVEFRHASLAQGLMPVVPLRESQRIADREPPAAPPRRIGGVRFFSHRQPATVDRIPFEDQRRSLERLASEGPGRAAPPSAPRSADMSEGWRRFGSMRRSEPASGVTPQSHDGGRFGSARTGDAPAVRQTQPARRAESDARNDRPVPRPGRSFDSRGSSEIRISPPIVRERPAGGDGGFRGSGAPSRAGASSGAGASGARPAPSGGGGRGSGGSRR